MNMETFRTYLSRFGPRKIATLVTGIVLFPPVALLVMAALTPLPAPVRDRHAFDSSVRVLDRNGRLLAEVRADDGARARWVPLDEVGLAVQHAIIAAEDKRFYHHPGVDPIAIARAVIQNAIHAKVVSGASTLTQQLARTLRPHRRSLWGKLQEMALALRIEASLSKRDILEQYFNRVAFGPSVRGIDAASHWYFDKPCSALSLSEAAVLASLPRGPSLYDPRSPHHELLLGRRDRILDRMRRGGWIDAEETARARREPILARTPATGWGAPHLTRGLLNGAVHPEIGSLSGRVSVIRTTIDAALQREVQSVARELLTPLRQRHATAASVVVLDNASGEVLAWLGAPDFLDDDHLGQNDGVLARRQPGSTLKPFVYAVAMEDLGWTAATVLPDIDLHIATEQGDYHPHNYDGHLHGPVRLREALANSYNVPAVYAASAVSPARVLDRLHEVGFRTFDHDANHYGPAIALGDGEVRLIDLATAYSTLARGGIYLPFRAIAAADDTNGLAIPILQPAAQRVMDVTTTAVLLDILKDPQARSSSFGLATVLDLPFEVAVKTGTSKGFRDNLTVGVTHELTVAVWVGNFDGSAMEGVSGITGAGPLFRAVMLAAARTRPPSAAILPIERLEPIEVCALSGKRPTAACKHKLIELFPPGQAPEHPCDMHAQVTVDRRNGLLADRSCPSSEIEIRDVESFDSEYISWARSTQRPIEPSAWSPLCSRHRQPPTTTASSKRLAVRYPYANAVFLTDPSLPSQTQGLVVRADVPPTVRQIRFVLDGDSVAVHGAPFEHVAALTVGSHRVWVEADGIGPSEVVAFEVR